MCNLAQFCLVNNKGNIKNIMIVQPCTILFSEQKGNIKNIIIMQPCSAQLLQLLLHTQLRLILIIMIMLNFARTPSIVKGNKSLRIKSFGLV